LQGMLCTLYFVTALLHSVCFMSYGQPICFFRYYWGKQCWSHFCILDLLAIVWGTIAIRSCPVSSSPICQFLFCRFVGGKMAASIICPDASSKAFGSHTMLPCLPNFLIVLFLHHVISFRFSMRNLM